MMAPRRVIRVLVLTGGLLGALAVAAGCSTRTDGTITAGERDGSTTNTGVDSGAGHGGGAIGGGLGAGGAGGGTVGAGGTGGAGAAASAGCPVSPSQCTDGIDNDGDGRIDGDDPECVGACDNDEGSFATGIAGDNVDACKQDCFFDGNSGMGDDGCEWNLKCDPANPGASASKSCPYDPKYKNCPATQSDRCIKSCQRVTPNGCDCFGCCAVTFNGQPLSVRLASTCRGDKLADPAACPRCTQQTSCLNPCGKCEVCVGKPAPDPSCALTSGHDGGAVVVSDGGLFPDAGAAPPEERPCPPGITYCGPGGVACSNGAVCLTGCCVIP